MTRPCNLEKSAWGPQGLLESERPARGTRRTVGGVLLLAANMLLWGCTGAPAELIDKSAGDTQRSNERPSRFDLDGDPLPEAGIARMGSARLRHGDRIFSVIFTNGGKGLASCGSDGCVRFWDAATGRAMGWREGFAVSPDGRTIVTRHAKGRDRRVVLVDAQTHEERCHLTGHQGGIEERLVFSPNGKMVVGQNMRKELYLWDTRNGYLLRRLEKALRYPLQVAFSADAKRLAYAGDWETGEIVVCGTASGEFVRRLKGPTKGVIALALSSDGKKVASASLDRTLRIWDVETTKACQQFAGFLLSDLAFLPNGKSLVSNGQDGVIRFWDPETAKEQRRLLVTVP